MNCMKCGTEISDGHVFCESCLADMKRFPVKPGTRVQIPARPPVEEIKKAPPRRLVLTPEERIQRLHGVIKWLSIFLAGAILALVFTVYLLLDPVVPMEQRGRIGQNYSTVTGDSD